MTSTADYLSGLATPLNADVELRENIREAVKDLEVQCRAVLAVLAKVHGGSFSTEAVIALCALAEAEFAGVRAAFQKLAALIPAGQYYRYCDHWSRTSQQLCFAAAFLVYLKSCVVMDASASAQLITVDQLQALTGVAVNAQETFHLPIEDMLHGFVSLSNELARLAVTSVIAADYRRPLRIAAFLEELYAGFQLLNLRNDMLRKRFDSMKYDIKKVEEVVYNITLRGLVPKE